MHTLDTNNKVNKNPMDYALSLSYGRLLDFEHAFVGNKKISGA